MFNAENIKKIRIQNNKTQEEAAQLLNVSRSSYAMWESNNNIIPLKRLITICDYFHTSIDYIFGFVNIGSSVNASYDLSLCSKRLKEIRKGNKLTQQQMASFLHIDQPTWSIYENGKSLIGTPFLYDLCKKYHVSADYLLGKTDSPKYLDK